MKNVLEWSCVKSEKRQSQDGLFWSPYSNLSLYNDCLRVCYVLNLCARVMCLLPVCVMCSFQSMLCVGFSLCYLRALVSVMCGLQSVVCAVCSHEPRRFAPSMPHSARVARFARCGRFAPARPASNRKLPCVERGFWTLTFAPRSYIYR